MYTPISVHMVGASRPFGKPAAHFPEKWCAMKRCMHLGTSLYPSQFAEFTTALCPGPFAIKTGNIKKKRELSGAGAGFRFRQGSDRRQSSPINNLLVSPLSCGVIFPNSKISLLFPFFPARLHCFFPSLPSVLPAGTAWCSGA